MSLRICLVTPFAWSQHHEANEHLRVTAETLRERGHRVTILGPSTRTSELSAGRRALRLLERDRTRLDGFVALGPAVPVSRYERVGVPVGIRANLRLALETSEFDVVHVYDPARMGISYHALLLTDALTVATFHSPDRVGHPAGKKRRERLLTRVDVLTATSHRALEAARQRFPGQYELLPLGISTDRPRQGAERDRPLLVVEWHPEERERVRHVLRSLLAVPEWDVRILRLRTMTGRPYIPRALRERCEVMTARDGARRQELLSQAMAFVGALDGSTRAQAEAAALGVLRIDPDVDDLPATLRSQPENREAAQRQTTPMASEHAIVDHSAEALGQRLETIYGDLMKRRRQSARVGRTEPLGSRPWILCDLHMHTEFSHDCSVPVPDLLSEAEQLGLGAIAVTDHNVFGGAQLAAELAEGRDLVVIPGEEMKTERGEVIGLFLETEIPAGLSMEDTIVAIRDQGGLVYLPHPFDRMHSIARPETIHRLLPEIDVIEVYNARLLFEGYNDEALRFARKYNMLMGAGSDAHVLQGLGTGVVRMRAFEDSEEFLVSLASAELVRRPKSLLYLQGLKWVAQARERRTRDPVR